ncbi:MAG: ABC transporter substrate-binding protein [Moorea sp. SIO4A1]|uniref:ABC transporter substrate-binding protein n=1 Tax=Moorena sp. SIO4A1 TaxID=2607835 RepID=UPI00144FA97D|nr:ABC transporter substrate-binding protein [Moorena sp. SIO4A1]NEQ57187.1 ABC transporter substrate-binding protein [Moorena sp. SIO4A1]
MADHYISHSYRILQEYKTSIYSRTYKVNDESAAAQPCHYIAKEYKPLSEEPEVMEEAQKLFRQRVQEIRALKINGIANIKYQFRQGNSFYILRDYIEDNTIEVEIKNGKYFQEKTVKKILKKSLEILDKLHQAKIAQGNIRASNLIYLGDDQLTLLDIGDLNEIGGLQLVSGKVSIALDKYNDRYKPPKGNKERYRDDLYALGVVCIEMIRSQINPQLISHQSTKETIWRYHVPGKSPLQISDAFAKIIDKMILYEPQARYQSAKEILNDLDQLLDSKSKIPAYDKTQLKISIIRFRRKLFSNPLYALLIVVSLIGFAYLLLGVIQRIVFKPETCPIKIDDNISCGEESLLFGYQPNNKADGLKAFRNQDYQKASEFFKVSWEIEDRDPETLIYWNNAKLKIDTNIKPYTIAVGIPIRVDEKTAKEILRGIAQAQDYINNSEAKINGRPLRILIADDHNDVAHAKDRANQIASQSEIIAVVGHYASGITLKTLEVYQKHKIVIVAPISSSESLTDFCTKQKQCFFFRIVSNHNHSAPYLVDLLLDELDKNGLEKTAGVVYSHPDNYSNSFKTVIEKRVREKGTLIDLEQNDLSTPSFDAGQIIDYAQQNKVNAIFVVPDGRTTSYAIPNAIDLIKSNQGRVWIGGSSSIYDPQTLEGLSKENESVLSKFIAYSDWNRLEGCVDTPEGEAFCQQASKLWKTTQVSLRTATVYDAIMTIAKALETLPNPNRVKLQQALRKNNFSYSGVTGTVKFKPDGNRTEPPGGAVKVIRSTCDSAYHGLEFLPIEYVDEREC